MKIYQTKDYELVAKLNKPVHDLHCTMYPDYFKAYDFDEMKQIFKSQINKEHFLFLILEDEEEAAGFAWVELRNYEAYPFKKAYQSIYVHQISIGEGKRKKGYGTYLMNYIYKLAEDKDIKLVELDYWVKNEKAMAFYKKHGFKKYRESVYKSL